MNSTCIFNDTGYLQYKTTAYSNHDIVTFFLSHACKIRAVILNFHYVFTLLGEVCKVSDKQPWKYQITNEVNAV